jgi:hypothetical protein
MSGLDQGTQVAVGPDPNSMDAVMASQASQDALSAAPGSDLAASSAPGNNAPDPYGPAAVSAYLHAAQAAAGNWSPDDIARRIGQLQTKYPTLRGKGPGVSDALLNLAKQPVTDEELSGNVASSMSAQQASGQADVLNAMTDAGARWARWQAYTPEQQKVLLSTGIQAPSNPHTAGGFWSNLGSKLLSDVKGVLWHPSTGNAPSLLNVGGDVLSGATHAIGNVAQAGAAVGSAALTDTAPGRVLNAGLQASGIPRAEGNAGQWLNDAQQFFPHVYRAATFDPNSNPANPTSMPNQNAQGQDNAAGLGPLLWRAAFGGGSLTNAWEQTADGNRYHTPGAVVSANKALGENADNFALARSIAAKNDVQKGIEDWLGPAPKNPTKIDPVRAAKYQQALQVANTPPMIQAVRALTLGTESPGRDAARSVGLAEGTAPYNAVSGGVDAAFRWYSDPLILAGHAVEAARLARSVTPSALGEAIQSARLTDEQQAAEAARAVTDIRAPGYLKQLNALPLSPDTVTGNAQRLAVMTADAMKAHDYDALMQMKPAMTAAIDPLKTWEVNRLIPTQLDAGNAGTGIANANHVLDFMHEAVGQQAIGTGSFGTYISPNDVELPYLTKNGARRAIAKMGANSLATLSTTVDNLPGGVPAGDLAATQSRFAGIGNLWGDFQNLRANAIQSVTRQLPRANFIPLQGPDALPEFAKFVDTWHMDTGVRNQLVNQFGEATSLGARRDALLAATESGMRQAGISATDAGTEQLATWMQNLKTIYDPNGLDKMTVGGIPRNASLLPGIDNAMAMGIPSADHVRAISKMAALSDTLDGGLTTEKFQSLLAQPRLLANPTLTRIIHGYWAPAALLRAGFIPRVVAEELLTTVLRLNPKDLVKTAAGEVATSPLLHPIDRAIEKYGDVATSAGGGGLDPMSVAADAADHMTPAGGASNPTSRFAQMLSGLGSGVGDTIGRAAAAVAGPETVTAAQMTREARQTFLAARDGWKTLQDLQSGLAKIYGTGDQAAMANQESMMAAGAAEQQPVFERMARDPIIQKAFGHVFASRGGYADPLTQISDWSRLDDSYNPVTTVQMKHNFRNFYNQDPAFMSAAAFAFRREGSDLVGRAAMQAGEHYAGSEQQLAEVNNAFRNTRFTKGAGTRQEVVSRLRQAVNEDPAFKQQFADAIVKHESAGVTSEQRVRQMGGVPDPNLSVLRGQLVEAGTGSAARKQIARKLFDDGGLKVSPGAARALLPEGDVLYSKDGVTKAVGRAVRRAWYSPEYADARAGADWGTRHGVEQPVIDGTDHNLARVYYPAATPDFQLGGALPDLTKIPYRQTRDDVAKALALQGDRTETIARANPTGASHVPLSRWGSSDPERARAVAKILTGETSPEGVDMFEGTPRQAAIGYIDVPHEQLQAMNLAGPKTELPVGSPWTRDVKTLAADTERQRALLADHAPGVFPDGFHLQDYQLAHGTALTDDAVHGGGVLGNGITREQATNEAIDRITQHHVNLMMPGDTWHHDISQTLLAQPMGDVHFGPGHLVGKAASDLPNVVYGPQHMLLGKESMYQRLVRSGFEKVIGPAVDSMARQPLFIRNLAKGIRANEHLDPLLADQDLRQAVNPLIGQSGAADQWALRDAIAEHRQAIEGTGMLDQPGTGANNPALNQWLIDNPQHWDTLNKWDKMETNVDQEITAAAVDRAVRDTTPFINDHSVRSQFDDTVSNLSPFLWAQESFFRRWGRTLEYNPGALARLELTINGFRHMGLVRKDQFGQDSFVYPGSAALANTIGDKFHVPLSIPFTGEVKDMIPGTDRIGVPVAGPLMSIALNLAHAANPESAPINQADQVVAGRGAGRSMFDSIVPMGWARNAWHAINDNPDTSPQYVSARMQAAAMLAAGGHKPPDNATPQDLQRWQDQIRNYTRNILLMRAAFSFFTPATPSSGISGTPIKGLQEKDQFGPITPSDLNATMSTMIKELGLPEGLKEFAKQYPDATPYTVFGSQSVGGETVPATAAAGAALAANPKFFSSHPAAGAYFLPAAPGNVDKQTWLSEMAAGLRVRKDFPTMTDEITNSAAGAAYYPSRQTYYDALSKLDPYDSYGRTQLTKQWQDWQLRFLDLHPVFKVQLQDSQAHAKRVQAISDMTQALSDANVPKGAQTDDMAGLLSLYRDFQQVKAVYAADRTSYGTNQRHMLDQQGAQKFSDYVAAHPGAQAFYDRAIRPELVTADRTLAALLPALQGGN